MKKGFTLAEVMITLTVIGIITAVILPVAFHSKPDQDVMKFKKAHNTLFYVIQTLINSSEYYLDGNFTKRSNGEFINGKHDGDATYFCNTIADVLSTKKIDCDTTIVTSTIGEKKDAMVCLDTTPEIKARFDNQCKEFQQSEIVTTDDITYYQPKDILFGLDDYFTETCPDGHVFLETVEQSELFDDYNEFLGSSYRCYKTFCIDIDGINRGVDPFGYGIRADGKIMNGKRADEWLEKSIQGEN